MRILHLGKFYPPYSGGMENFLHELCQEQIQTGHQIQVLAHWHKKGLKSRMEKTGQIVLTRAAILGELAYTPLAPTFYLHLRRIIRSFQPDIIHIHLPNPSAFWILALPVQARIILHWHADALSPQAGNTLKTLYQLYRFPETALLRKAHRIIVTSQEYLQYSPALHRMTHKCRIVPLGLDPERLTYAIPAAPVRKNTEPPLVLSLGRFTFYKGFAHLIQAARYVHQARFVIIGDGPLRPSLKRMIKDLNLEERFFLPGHLTDFEVSQYFKRACLFCLPSVDRAEAFGLVLLEAMAHGLPLLTGKVKGSGMNFVNVHGQTGLHIPPQNPRALAWAINRLLEDSPLRTRLGRQAKERFNEYFHIQRISAMLNKVYSETTDS